MRLHTKMLLAAISIDLMPHCKLGIEISSPISDWLWIELSQSWSCLQSAASQTVLVLWWTSRLRHCIQLVWADVSDGDAAAEKHPIHLATW